MIVANPQKESLGEYGSGWGWDSTYAHVFDQTDVNDTPKQYFSNGAQEGICSNGVDITDGQILYSQSQMFNQRSCKPNVENAGNYYSFPAATAEGKLSSGNEPNSVCPKGWMLTTNSGEETRSFSKLIQMIYGATKNDFMLLYFPLSFVRSGIYSNSNLAQGGGFYWTTRASSNVSAHRLGFNNGWLSNGDSMGNKNDGSAVRCVAH